MMYSVTQNYPGQITEILSLHKSKKRSGYMAGEVWSIMSKTLNLISPNIGNNKTNKINEIK